MAEPRHYVSLPTAHPYSRTNILLGVTLGKPTSRARKIAIESAMYELLTWYFENGAGAKEPTACEDRRSYGGVVLRWMSPPIPHVLNPVLVERHIGDVWTLEFKAVDGKLL